MQLLTIIAVGTLLTAVTAQTGQPIVDRTQYYVGETFNITCDITKFSGVPTAPYLSKLSLMRQPLTETKFTEIAIYQPFLPNPNDQNVTTLPSGRQWIVQYSGGVSQTNRQTIKIVTTVVGLRCDDAGLYKCYLELPRYPSNDSTIANLTVKAQITQDDLSVSPKNGDDPYFSSYRLEENNNITISMSCTFRGPGNLKAVWKWKPQDSNEENYPTQNEIVDERPVTSTSAGCTSSSYRSTLSFQLQPDNNGAIYYCTVEENNVEMSRANFTIDIEPTNPSQQTASAGGPDVGAIVGGVIGGVVFLIIVIVLIYFFVIRKKRQGGDEEEKRKDVETTDSGKDNNFTPPPVFYSKPHKPPKDERDGSRGDASLGYTPYNGVSHAEEDQQRLKNLGKSNPSFTGDIHYASVDVSGSEDSPPPRPRRKHEFQTQNNQLHYLELDVPKKPNSRKPRNVEPVEYSEIQV